MSQATIDRIKNRMLQQKRHDGVAVSRNCEIAGCDREGRHDVPATDRNGDSDVLVVCQPCMYAYKSGAKDPNAYK